MIKVDRMVLASNFASFPKQSSAVGVLAVLLEGLVTVRHCRAPSDCSSRCAGASKMDPDLKNGL